MKNSDINIDLLGLKCPMPVLKANKKLINFKSGDVVNFLVDDESAPKDFEVLCKTKGYKLLKINKEKFITICIQV